MEYEGRILTGDLADTPLQFRVNERVEKTSLEYTGTFVRATGRQFKEVVDSAPDIDLTENPLREARYNPNPMEVHKNRSQSPKRFTMYADYKHFREVFPDKLAALDAATAWDKIVVDYPATMRKHDCTLWLGSLGAHTPLHYDTYGCNVVCQISGSKRWRIWQANAFQGSAYHAKRVPYEESSVYSTYDPFVDTSVPPYLDVELERGDILFVPKHHWHFVETTSAKALSVNQWLPMDTDPKDMLSEAFVRLCHKGIRHAIDSSNLETFTGCTREGWINPSEDSDVEYDNDVDYDEVKSPIDSPIRAIKDEFEHEIYQRLDSLSRKSLRLGDPEYNKEFSKLASQMHYRKRKYNYLGDTHRERFTENMEMFEAALCLMYGVDGDGPQVKNSVVDILQAAVGKLLSPENIGSCLADALSNLSQTSPMTAATLSSCDFADPNDPPVGRAGEEGAAQDESSSGGQTGAGEQQTGKLPMKRARS
jgi:HSPB1-associated protein 1